MFSELDDDVPDLVDIDYSSDDSDDEENSDNEEVFYPFFASDIFSKKVNVMLQASFLCHNSLMMQVSQVKLRNLCLNEDGDYLCSIN